MALPNKRQRRYAAREKAVSFLQDLLSGKGDPYLSYKGLHSLWLSRNAAVPELRPLFRIDGIEASSALSIDQEFKSKVLPVAADVLKTFLESPERNSDPNRGVAKRY